ncbi:lipid asymmetry maintenance protein MlaB [Affinibrenneria salicis]|uniref:Lipid asymmetry maintenance protein MlaB n=1 Tax=Affinibrenneria salicis TaxID=2590031 RepID=A0A5J5FYD9_9GAMM|nr:lipid asymmetry maintenance protein MlaB [Affinibrenneria salicis]KAA8999241.1 lipid asymmetry maintenance protein MlaB [Affinibrenneria salicis]
MATPLSWQAQGDVLCLQGDLDRDTLLPFWRDRESLLADKRALDVSRLERVDSAGLALLLHASQQRVGEGIALPLHGAGDRLQTLIALYNLNEIIPLE